MPGQRTVCQQFPRCLLYPRVHLGELGIADQLAIHADTLVHANKMRRGVKASVKLCRLQNGSKLRRGGAFAVGAGNQHAGKTPLGMPKRVEQHAHVGQIKFVRRSLRQLVAELQQF